MAGIIDKTTTASDTNVDWDCIPFPPAAIIQTDRLNIRPLHMKDAPRLSELANDVRVAEGMSNRFPFPYELSDAKFFLEKFAGPPEAGKPYIQFGIALKEDSSKIIGAMGIHPGGDVFCRAAELGYWIGADYHGKGYATEAAHAVVNYGFELENGLNGIEGESLMYISANIYAFNHASRKVLMKIGLKVEGIQRGTVWKRGKLSDLILFGNTREDWEQNKV